MKTVKVGVIGCGGVSGIHLKNLQALEQFEVVWAADVVSSTAQQRAETFGIPHWTQHYHDVLDDAQVDAVLVLTPPTCHAEIVVEALRAGKHVFCEKPMAMSTAQCQTMQEAVEQSDRVFFLAYPLRFSPDALNLRELIRTGRLGRPVFYRDIWALSRGTPSRAIHDEQQGGGVLFENSHCLDFMRFIFGPWNKVYAVTTKLKPEDTTAQDTVAVIIEFESADCAVWSDSWAAPGFGWEPLGVGRLARPTLDVIGSRGSLHFPTADGRHALSLYEKDKPYDKPSAQWAWEGDWGANMEAYVAELKHFYECICDGVSPRCTAADGAAVIGMIEAIHESSRSGMPVVLETANR